MSSVAKFRLRQVFENTLFAVLVIALIVWKPVWWIAVLAVAAYIGAAILLYRLAPPPPR